MLEQALLVALAAAPCVALLIFFARNERSESEKEGRESPYSARLLGITGLGALAAFSAYGVQTLVGHYGPPLPPLIFCFGVVSLSEEGLKFLVTRLFMRGFKEPYHGIVYSVACAMGFALAENIRYVLSSGLTTGLLRAFLPVPAHALFGVSMGYFLGRARFCHNHKDRNWNIRVAFFLPILMHGFYDYAVMRGGTGQMLIFPLVGLFWLAGLWQMDLHLSVSPRARFVVDSPAFALIGHKGVPVQVLDMGLGGVQFLSSKSIAGSASLLLSEHSSHLVVRFEVLTCERDKKEFRHVCRFRTLKWRTRKRLELFLGEFKEGPRR